MLRVALTGGVGSGKSSAAAMLRALGAHVSQSDEVGRDMMRPGQPVFLAIRDHFGRSVLASDGQLDRSALATIAFQEGRVDELNAIVHPAVIAAQSQWMDSVAAQDPSAVAVVESALIFETKFGASVRDDGDFAPWRTRFDRIVLVTAPIELRQSRYVQRAATQAADAASADFDRRVAAQWSDTRKAALADFVIPNEGHLNQLRDRIATLYLELRQEAADAVSEAM